jgi:serine/threonine-protein kinase
MARDNARPQFPGMRDVAALLASALAGHYEIQRELGRGGAAAVFAATDIRHGRDVAIKVLDTSDSGGGDRFQREVALIARLRHPHIVPMYDSGRHGELCWFVMRCSTAARCAIDWPGPRHSGSRRRIRIASDIADALAHAHRHGVIHRDVKPENILLEGDHAALSDFGIARATAPDDDRLTTTGVVVGTPPT